VSEANILTAQLNVTSGALRMAFLKWGSCPTEQDIDFTTGECKGFCEVAWLATRGAYSGVLYNTSSVKFSLPFGGGAALDKRRGGQWYLGVRALDNVAAEFQVAVTFQQPSLGSASPVRDCSRFKPMCSSDSARTAWKSDGKARAPETSAPAPPQLPARDGLYRSFGVNSSLSSQTFAPPAVFVFAVVVLGCCVRSLYVRHKRRRPIRV